MLSSISLQQENGSTRPVSGKYYEREVTAFVVAFRLATESSGLRIPTPSVALFLSKSSIIGSNSGFELKSNPGSALVLTLIPFSIPKPVLHSS
ncbi:hypothetical protein EVAR_18241_1 [Eumeta japonica]|uniref:Uncharacterized protein n=1 Tax=Eumeta variegata TaxID=151549 RepID=A0A4C1UL48_EUMVA|nr:hypothetical protein EVAR_18241_1 [Eumeta japonica]